MSTTEPTKPIYQKHTVAEWSVYSTPAPRRRLLCVAKHNVITTTTARRIIASGHVVMQKWSARVAEEVLGGHHHLLGVVRGGGLDQHSGANDGHAVSDHQVDLSTTTIRQKLQDQPYTTKQVCAHVCEFGVLTCNSETNKWKHEVFTHKPVQYQLAGDLIVYYGETNYNLFCSRRRGHTISDSRPTVTLPASQRPKLQVQCAVAPEIDLGRSEMQWRSIKMDVNASFVTAVALVRLRAGRIEAYLALHREDMLSMDAFSTLTARWMDLLKRAATASLRPIDNAHLLSRMTAHCQLADTAALRSEGMKYD
ncbi:hypothetical protein PybrP1_011190, partial [[Pythium] brassicae (nom. inval.)]